MISALSIQLIADIHSFMQNTNHYYIMIFAPKKDEMGTGSNAPIPFANIIAFLTARRIDGNSIDCILN